MIYSILCMNINYQKSKLYSIIKIVKKCMNINYAIILFAKVLIYDMLVTILKTQSMLYFVSKVKSIC
jgi:hypothetical protein